MNLQIQEIAQRLHGLRDALEITVEDIAGVCHVTPEEYLGYETGEMDIPVSVLENVSKKYHVDLTALLFGTESHTKAFCLTRSGQGTAMERTEAYKYQALATGFIGRKADPFIVSVEPVADDVPMHLNSHEGHEFNFVIEGSMMISIDGHKLTLNEGDSLYFDATRQHGMKALNGKHVKFLAIIF